VVGAYAAAVRFLVAVIDAVVTQVEVLRGEVEVVGRHRDARDLLEPARARVAASGRFCRSPRYWERYGPPGVESDAGMATSVFLVLLEDRTAHTTFSLSWECQP
jgi:hypothetical protein